MIRHFWGWHRHELNGRLEKYMDRRLWKMDRELSRASEDLHEKFSPVRFPGWRTPFGSSRNVSVEVAKDGSQKMVVRVDVSHFKPEQVKVTLEDDGLLTVRAKDAGNGIHREYVKEVALPEGVDQESIRSILGKDGMLRIEAQLLPLESPSGKEIPIQKASEKQNNS